MREFKLLLACLSLLPLCLAEAGATPQPARPIQLQQYSGRWYEVARLHNGFEDGSVADTCLNAQVSYTPTADGGYRVVDTCLRANGRSKEWKPSMKVLDPGTNAKFRLTFFPFVYKDYWVLDYAPDNSWVVLGEPTGRYLWLFSRTPDLKAHKAALVAKAKTLGYDTGRLIYDRGS